MQQKIKILPELVSNQIAAGEVVEGPASIIKELFENSVDAGSKKIEINLSKNLLRIELIDDGQGIAKEDLSLAFKKHATSKIEKIEDLDLLNSNGFRGEALASISAVSKLTCISRQKDSKEAYKIYIENGKESISETGFGFGTKIIIDELFFNTPARLKFLKSSSKERNNIIDTCRGLCFANTQIKVKLNIDNKNIIETSGSGNIDKCLEEVFKAIANSDLLKIENSTEKISITGSCSKIHNTRTDKRGLFTIVNNRFIDCYIIKSAIDSVYKDLIPKGKYPIVVIKIGLPSSEIDVNVHPNKKEIKYKETNKLYTLVQDSIDKALRANAYQENETMQTQIKDSKPEFEIGVRQARIELSTSKIEKYKPKEIVSKAPSSKFEEIIREQKASLDNDDTIKFNSQRFSSRFGSIDIKILDNIEEQTVTSTQGNKTRFDYVHKNFKDKKSVVFQGEFIGENWIREKLYSFLAELGDEILEKEKHKTKILDNRSRPQKRPSKKVLAKIWQRDNYTCVYCKKALLDPSLIKEKLKLCSKPQELNDHIASFDHHLPASKFGELNLDEQNLHAVCKECNIQKSDSLASQTWKPQVSNAWERPLRIAGIDFEKPTLN